MPSPSVPRPKSVSSVPDKRYSTSSPYYSGLTDFSLAMSRQKRSSSSPGRESYATRTTSNSSSSVSVLAKKVQKWNASFFPFIGKGVKYSSLGSFQSKRPEDNNCDASSSSSSRTKGLVTTTPRLASMSTAVSIMDSARKEVNESSKKRDNTVAISNYQKPLMEKASEPLESVEKEVKDSSRKHDNTVAVSNNQKPVREKPSESLPPPPLAPETSQASLPLATMPSLAATETAASVESIEKEVKEISKKSDNTVAESSNQKPLREKASEPLPPPPLGPQTSQEYLPPESSLQTLTLSPIQPGHFPARTVIAHHKKVITEEDTSMPWNERKFVWADKYRPLFLKDFLCNRNKALELKAMTRNGEHGHFIFEGPPGVGKRTMIWALLREVFGPDKLQAREESKEFYLKGEAVTSICANVKVSSKHVEVNLSELGGYEKHVIVHLIKEKNKRLYDKDLQHNHEDCRAIILCRADKLSTDALFYIRWLLERYKGCTTIFFCCSDATKLQPLKSICKVVQLLQPSSEEIVNVLEFIAKQEGIKLPHHLAVTIANNSKNNLRQAIRSFEATWHSNPSLKENQEILTGWEDDIADIARNIIEEQSAKQLYVIRGKLKNLIEHNVSPEFICKTLVEEIKTNVDEELHQQMNKLLRKYNTNCEKHGKKEDDRVTKTIQQFMGMEEFIAQFMSWYKNLLEKKGI